MGSDVVYNTLSFCFIFSCRISVVSLFLSTFCFFLGAIQEQKYCDFSYGIHFGIHLGQNKVEQ